MLSLTILTACGGDDEEPEVPALNPEVTSFSPVQVVEGTTVTISGTDFPTDPSQITVTFFDGVQATIVSASATEIVVTVPEGAQNGPITVTIDGTAITTTTEADVRLDIPRDGLVAFYPFTGDATDASDNSNDGTVSGATLTADRYGNPNSAYSFDGVDDFIEVADDATLDITGAITMSAWINVSTLRNSSVLAKFDETANDLDGYILNITSNDGVVEPILNNNPFRSDSGPSISSVWAHYAMTWDGSELKIFINGNLLHTEVYTGVLSVNDNNLIIGDNIVQDSFHGLIDDVTIYNKALTSDEVTQLYSQTVTK
jgi:hypothetical protein